MDRIELPPEWKQAGYGLATTFFMAWLGRMMWHVDQVRKRQRRFWSWHLLWELPTALAIGFVADGVSEYLALDGRKALALIIVLAYLGPAGIESIVGRILDRFVGPARKPD